LGLRVLTSRPAGVFTKSRCFAFAIVRASRYATVRSWGGRAGSRARAVLPRSADAEPGRAGRSGWGAGTTHDATLPRRWRATGLDSLACRGTPFRGSSTTISVWGGRQRSRGRPTVRSAGPQARRTDRPCASRLRSRFAAA
jgi:hypothetical protein